MKLQRGDMDNNSDASDEEAVNGAILDSNQT